MLLYQMYVLHEGRARLTELVSLYQVHSDMNLNCPFEEFNYSINHFDWFESTYDHFVQCYTEFELDVDDPYVLLIFRVDPSRANLASHFAKVQELININSKLFDNFSLEVHGDANDTLH